MMTNGFVFYTLLALLVSSSLIMILLVLIQRGRGGGLAGAFGGMGGQSALGVRAGDVFTKITIVVAVVWVSAAGLLGISMRAIAETEAVSAPIFAGAAPDEEAAEPAVDVDDDPVEVKKAEEPADAAAPAEAGEEKSDADATDADSEKADAEEDAADPKSKEGDATAPAENTDSAEEPAASDSEAKPEPSSEEQPAEGAAKE